ncbi:hypothetical protein ACHAXH_006278 [Discostella pseudostelligera]
MTSDATLPSQELFDETVLENEECFDLSPDEALRETIDQFCQQLGVVGIGVGATPSPTSVAVAASSSNGDDDEQPATCHNDESTSASVVIPAALSHLVLSHPNSLNGKRDRSNRSQFQNWLALLDSYVGTDGKVNVNSEAGTNRKSKAGSDVENVLEALVQIGRHCRFGDNSSDQDSGIDNGEGNNKAPNDNTKCMTSGGNSLPYLTIFQRSSSIYTLMSFLSILDPTQLSNHAPTDATIQILPATARTLSSTLVNNPTNDDYKCTQIRSELRDLFVPAIVRLVCLLGGIVKKLICSSAEVDCGDDAASDDNVLSLSLLLCELLQLATNATRGCESAKVTWVQSTLLPELSHDAALSNSTITTKRGGVAVIVSCLSMTLDNDGYKTRVLIEACQLLASLCRYDDFRDATSTTNKPNTSSAHDHAMEFYRAGALTFLIKIAKCALLELGKCDLGDCSTANDGDLATTKVISERLASAVLTALRVLAVNDEIIQTMVALGILPIVTEAFKLGLTDAEMDDNMQKRKQRIVAPSLGLLRNLSGNDEIKTNLCLGSSNDQSSRSSTPSILPHILHAMKAFQSTGMIQEHACGTLAAMALRRPANARAILDAGGPRWVLTAMKRHDTNVNVQRQGALAIRNIVSRLLRGLPDDDSSNTSTSVEAGSLRDEQRNSIRDAFLELGAEDVLRNIAGRHQGSVDEAYAALRDLGCKVSMVKFNADELQDGQKSVGIARTMMFGQKHNTNFRPVYEESAGLLDGVDNAVSHFGS